MSRFRYPSDCLNHQRYDNYIRGIHLVNPSWQFISLPQFSRNAFNPLPSLLQRPFEEVDSYRSSKSIDVAGFDVPKPAQNFEEVNFPQGIQVVIKQTGFSEPTPIQAQSWSIALSGRDMIGVAVTGSGKTLAYLLPAITQVLSQRQYVDRKYPLAVILAPTRELALQIHQVLIKFSMYMPVRTICIYGGINVQQQLDTLGKNGVDIVVATPGRLLHFMSINRICLYYCTYIVIDEADLMLAMGFIPQIQRVLGQIRKDRQVLMFSATFPATARSLATQILMNYIHVTVGTVNQNILQIVMVCEEEEKKEKLYQLLKEIQCEKNKQTLLFVKAKKKALILTENLKLAGFNVEGFHAGKKQKVREKTLKQFKAGEITTLVTTDVASRGLDIKEIRYVINYDFPKVVAIYVHRIGRTARGNKHGTAFTFFTDKDWHQVGDLIDILKDTNQRIPSDLLQEPVTKPVLGKRKRKK